MAGQHIEREARYEQTGLTSVERDRVIWDLRHRQHWSQQKIARYLGMTQPGIKYALDRLAGKPRTGTKYEVCDGCGRSFPRDQINRDGFCEGCGE